MIKNDSWDAYDEDGYPAGEDHELEYIEECEEEDEDYPVGYDPIQGNWSYEDYDNVNSFEKIGRRRERIRSVKTYTDNKKKKQQIKQRSQAQAKEKYRQQYYHYSVEDSDN